MIPIDRVSKDPFFRYKMPQAQIARESTKTVITNLDQIAQSLHRSPIHILKFLSMLFGCSCIQGQKALNGNFETQRIQSAVFDYIDFFVLCKRCRSPETYFVYDQVLKRACNSCGDVFVQDAHKLNVLIVRDKDKSSNVDTNYTNRASIHDFLGDAQDNAQEIYTLYKQEGWTLDDIFSVYIRPKDLKQLSLVLEEHKLDTILDHIEDMVESSKKENKIGSFVKALMKVGCSSKAIEQYFSRPRGGKRRSPLIKKSIEFFFENEEAQS